MNSLADENLDLSGLALDRQPATVGAVRGRKWVSRYLLPAALLIGFGSLLAVAAGNAFWPRRTVSVKPVVSRQASIQQAGVPLFQAAGWIEPRPTAIDVTSLTNGVINALLVVEGQNVKAGEPIAKLLAVDGEIRLQQSQSALAEAEGELQRTIAARDAAELRLKKPVHLQVQLADAKSKLAKSETELTNLPFQIESAEAEYSFAKQSVEGKRSAGRAVSGVVVQKAEAELAAADAKLRELKRRAASLENEVDALRSKVEAIASQMEMLIEETRQLGEAEANVATAKARKQQAEIQIRKSELELKRTTIVAPIDGRILRLVAAPGMKVSGIAGNGDHDSSLIVQMYDPQRLQVRADVRLEDVPLIQPGQPVEISTSSSPEKILGRVLQPNSTANIQKNTLEVKVEIMNPPATIRPEMLVQATFLAPEESAADSDGAGNEAPETVRRIFVSSQWVSRDEQGDFIWTVDGTSRARKSRVETSDQGETGILQVLSGLDLSSKVIVSDTSDLRDGELVDVE